MGNAEDTSLRLEREKDFHDRRFSTNDGHRNEDKFYRALHSLEIDFLDAVHKFGHGADVLDYGCGSGERAILLANNLNAKSIVGIDISQSAIDLAIALGAQSPLKPTFRVDNCENTSLPAQSLDLVYGNGIIHHLETEKSVIELKRLLRPNGHIVFYEPLGTNPLINLYRQFTPNSRSPDEHPLLAEDFKIIKAHFSDVSLTYYGFLTIAALPLYTSAQESIIYKFSERLDRFLFRFIPPFRLLAWTVLIIAKK